MFAVSRNFTVHQPVGKVTDYLKDFTNARDWDPGTIDCVRVDTGPVGIGSRWVNISALMGQVAVLNYRLETAGPDFLVFRGSNGPARSRDALGFSETAGGGTLIAYQAEITLDGAPRMSGLLPRRSFDRLFNRVVAQMTQVIDAL